MLTFLIGVEPKLPYELGPNIRQLPIQIQNYNGSQSIDISIATRAKLIKLKSNLAETILNSKHLFKAFDDYTVY